MGRRGPGPRNVRTVRTVAADQSRAHRDGAPQRRLGLRRAAGEELAASFELPVAELDSVAAREPPVRPSLPGASIAADLIAQEIAVVGIAAAVLVIEVEELAAHVQPIELSRGGLHPEVEIRDARDRGRDTGRD